MAAPFDAAIVSRYMRLEESRFVLRFAGGEFRLHFARKNIGRNRLFRIDCRVAGGRSGQRKPVAVVGKSDDVGCVAPCRAVGVCSAQSVAADAVRPLVVRVGRLVEPLVNVE